MENPNGLQSLISLIYIILLISRSLNKGKVAEMVRLKTGWEAAMAQRAVEASLDGIRNLLRLGGRLTIHGFGSFEVRITKPRKGRNIQTGEEVFVPARREVKFRMSPDFLGKSE